MRELSQQLEEFFKDVSFTESNHQYNIGDYKLKLSVSGVVGKFKNTFDASVVSHYTAIKEGISQEEVLKNWDDIREEACSRGNRVHIFGELYAKNRNLIPSCNQEKAVVKFWNDLPEHIVLVQCELVMFHREKLFGGTADIIAFNTETKTFVILDYKTNKDLFKNHNGQMLNGVFSDLLDTPFNHYQIQLSLYQILLEQAGIKVSSRKLIWLRKDGEYELFDTEDYTKKLKLYLETTAL